MRPSKYKDLRDAGKLHGTIKRAVEIRKERDERRRTSDRLALPRDERLNKRKVLVSLGINDRIYDAANRLRAEHPRRKNWVNSAPGYISFVAEINCGRYSGRCKYTKWEYRPIIESWAVVVHGAIWFHFDGDITRIKAPRGYEWRRDENGLYLWSRRLKADYHPTASELMAGVRHCVTQLKANRTARLIAKRKSRQQVRVIKAAEQQGATVCLRDSIRAGNCYAGSASWARRHNLDPAGHYAPSELLQMANGETSRVAIVVAVALKRHAEEMHRGYAILSEHTV